MRDARDPFCVPTCLCIQPPCLHTLKQVDRVESVVRRCYNRLASAYTNASVRPSIRQHTSAYVSIRQHSSAYVSIRSVESVVRRRYNRLAAAYTNASVRPV
jgi:hypothetical protein